jgi:hypothetical protein
MAEVGFTICGRPNCPHVPCIWPRCAPCEYVLRKSEVREEAVAEIEVTAEMVEAGLHAWFRPSRCGPADTESLVADIYRAMEEVRRKAAFARELRRHGIR